MGAILDQDGVSNGDDASAWALVDVVQRDTDMEAHVVLHYSIVGLINEQCVLSDTVADL